MSGTVFDGEDTELETSSTTSQTLSLVARQVDTLWDKWQDERTEVGMPVYLVQLERAT